MEEFGNDELISECKVRGLTVLPSASANDAEAAQIVERAYLACRDRPDMPRELKDLFWKVHDRAMP